MILYKILSVLLLFVASVNFIVNDINGGFLALILSGVYIIIDYLIDIKEELKK